MAISVGVCEWVNENAMPPSEWQVACRMTRNLIDQNGKVENRNSEFGKIQNLIEINE